MPLSNQLGQPEEQERRYPVDPQEPQHGAGRQHHRAGRSGLEHLRSVLALPRPRRPGVDQRLVRPRDSSQSRSLRVPWNQKTSQSPKLSAVKPQARPSPYPPRKGSRGGGLQHDLLAAPEKAQPEGESAEHGGDRERDLHAQEALAAPVDALELQQQGRLAQGQAHAHSDRHGEPGLEPLVSGQDPAGARGEGQDDPRYVVVDVPVADAQVAERPEAAPAAQEVRHRASQDEGRRERGEQVEHGILARRDHAVALARHLGGLRDCLLARSDRVMGAAERVRRPAPPHAAELHCHDGAHDRGRGGAEHERPAARLERAMPAAALHRTTRAGTPMTSAPGGTSVVTTAPAATNASSPTSTPGNRTAPAPMRQPRRRVAPRSSMPSGRRPAVGSLVRSAPGAMKTSSSTTERAVTYAPVCMRTRAPTRTSQSTDTPRPTTDSSPISARSRTCAWSPTTQLAPMLAPASTTAPAPIVVPAPTLATAPSSGGAALEYVPSTTGLPITQPS